MGCKSRNVLAAKGKGKWCLAKHFNRCLTRKARKYLKRRRSRKHCRRVCAATKQTKKTKKTEEEETTTTTTVTGVRVKQHGRQHGPHCGSGHWSCRGRRN